MKNLFFASLMTLFLFSCGETELQLSADQSAVVTEFVVKFDEMSTNESAALRSKIEDFYAVATVNNCEVENFPDVVTPEDVSSYIADIGHTTIRSFHDWAVDNGLKMREIVKNNPDWDEDILINQLITDEYTKLKGAGNACELETYTSYARKSLRLANSFGLYIGGTGYRTLTNADLLTFGGAFNTFVRMQDLQDNCAGASDLSK